MEFLGLVAGLALLIFLALRGVDIFLAALLCSLLVIVTNHIDLATGLTEYFPFGPLGAFTFAGKFFLLFVTGAIFGRIMGDSGAAASIGEVLVSTLGPNRVLWVIVLASSLLTYGGVVVFVVIFAMYPLGIKLLEQSDIPKRLFAGALTLGVGTFTLTALPGTPSIHNVISASALGTDLYAGPWIGLASGSAMLLFGMWYLEHQRKRAFNQGEHFIPGPQDKINSSKMTYEKPPKWYFAVLPLGFVLFLILSPRVLGGLVDTQDSWLFTLIDFSARQPILWPCISLSGGIVLAALLFPAIRHEVLTVAGRGTKEALQPLMNTAAVIGFGGVVTHTDTFQAFSSYILALNLPPLISVFLSANLVSGIVGSASGGLQIFMQTLAPAYLEMGIERELLHRVATIASGGLDSLPHGGGIISILTIMGVSHKEAYKDIGVVTVVIPMLVTLVLIGVLIVFHGQ